MACNGTPRIVIMQQLPFLITKHADRTQIKRCIASLVGAERERVFLACFLNWAIAVARRSVRRFPRSGKSVKESREYALMVVLADAPAQALGFCDALQGYFEGPWRRDGPRSGVVELRQDKKPGESTCGASSCEAHADGLSGAEQIRGAQRCLAHLAQLVFREEAMRGSFARLSLAERKGMCMGK